MTNVGVILEKRVKMTLFFFFFFFLLIWLVVKGWSLIDLYWPFFTKMTRCIVEPVRSHFKYLLCTCVMKEAVEKNNIRI